MKMFYLLGCVHPIIPYLVYPSSIKNWVSWVVLPDPVSPTRQHTIKIRSSKIKLNESHKNNLNQFISNVNLNQIKSI